MFFDILNQLKTVSLTGSPNTSNIAISIIQISFLIIIGTTPSIHSRSKTILVNYSKLIVFYSQVFKYYSSNVQFNTMYEWSIAINGNAVFSLIVIVRG